MNKSIIRMAMALSLLSSGGLYARGDFRSPLSVTEGMMHGHLKPVSSMWWHDIMMEDKEEESLWYIHTWDASFYRVADRSFFDPCDCSDARSSDKNTRKTVSLSTLFFGKEAFRGEDSFPGGIITDPQLLNFENVALGFSRITPRFDYNERGIVMGVAAERRLGRNNQWRIGGRVSVPFKVIELEQDKNCNLEETLDDVVRVRTISFDSSAKPNGLDFAARLDFLTTLAIPQGVDDDGDQVLIPFVRFNPSEFSSAVFGGVPVDTMEVDENTLVFARGSTDGSLPEFPFRRQAAAISASPLPAGGALGNDSFAFFQTDVSYVDALANDRDAQSRLVIIPQSAPDNNGQLVMQADGIANLLRVLLGNLEGFGFTSSTEFFRNRNIDLRANRHITGIGDIDLDMYFGYGYNDWFANYIVGVRFPTGKKQDSASDVFFVSTGNNRHWEVKLGLEGGWQPYDWFGFRLDTSYSHVFGRSERTAAPFKGATIRGIGPEVKADVSWNYFVSHVNFDFFHPNNPEIGCVIGYELFAKLDDNVSINCSTARDFFNRERELDPTILEQGTNSMTHKFRGEIFHRWNFFELFAGASRVIAGRHAMQESEAHVGVAVYF